jgi:glycosyltransferase involved in cell wall biosynthesis
MNIVLINQWYATGSDFGGIQAYMYSMARAYTKLGHRVHVISSLRPGLAEYTCADGVHIHRIKQMSVSWRLAGIPFVGGFLRFIRDVIYSFLTRQELLAIHRKHRVDIAEYAEINSEGFWHSLFGPKHIGFVVRCHTPYAILKKYFLKDERIFDNPFIYWMEKAFIKKAPYLTTPSNHLAEAVVEAFAVKRSSIKVVPNAIDTDIFFPARKEGAGDTITLLYVGRIERAKGVFVLAEALTRILKTCGKSLRCMYVGREKTTSQRESVSQKLRDLFSKEGIAGFIEIVGAVPGREKLLQYYQRCDIFINPSLIYESFSYTCLEAMSCAKPVIASKIGGIPEVVDDGKTGFLFEPANVGELTDRIRILIDDEEKRKSMGAKARERAKKFFDAAKVASENLKAYERIRSKSPAFPEASAGTGRPGM